MSDEGVDDQPYYEEDSVILRHPRGNLPGPEELVLAELLVQLNSFHEELLAARRKLRLKKLYEYPAANTDTALLDFSSNLKVALAERSAKEAQSLARRYKLSSAWLSPLRIAILTNHLPVPEDVPIRLIPPEAGRGLAALSRRMRLELLPDSNDLVLIISRDVSPDQLRKSINKPEFIKALRRLPSLPSTKSGRAVLVWGQIGWLLKEDYPRESWKKRLKRLEGMVGNKQGLPELPLTPEELVSNYQRYLDAIRRLSKSKS